MIETIIGTYSVEVYVFERKTQVSAHLTDVLRRTDFPRFE